MRGAYVSINTWRLFTRRPDERSYIWTVHNDADDVHDAPKDHGINGHGNEVVTSREDPPDEGVPINPLNGPTNIPVIP